MYKVKDILKSEDMRPFYAYSKYNSSYVIQWLGSTTNIELLDVIFISEYGERIASPTLELINDYSDNYLSYWNRFFNIFKSRWDKAFSALVSSYKVYNPYDLTETHTGTDTVSNSGDDTTINSDMAYNSTDFADKEKTVHTAGTSKETTYNTTITKSGNGGINISERITDEIKMRWRYWIYKLICKDLVDLISLDIYE